MKEGMNLVICIPGENLTGVFFDSLMIFISELQKYKGMTISVVRKSGSHIAYLREVLMGYGKGQNISSKNRVFWDGKYPDYDYILWLDTDQIFTINDFMKLVDDDQPIMSGYYKMVGPNDTVCVVEKRDDELFAMSQYMSFEELSSRTELVEAWHTGFGFMLIKRGVFEKMEAPFFMDSQIFIEGEKRYGGEDVAFCYKARKAGFKIYVDPRVRVGHYKSVVL